MLPTIHISRELALPDTDLWQFRFQVQSESSNRLYTVSQHKKLRHWGCSCPGWKAHRKCKHLEALGLPFHQKPFEINLIKI